VENVWLPALYRLAGLRLLPPGFAVLGNSRTPLSDEAFRDKMRESVAGFLEDTPLEEEVWGLLAKALFYVPGDIHDAEWSARLARGAGLECRPSAVRYT
jgi:glucose-6-phosphate 1-dehydrogenase